MFVDGGEKEKRNYSFALYGVRSRRSRAYLLPPYLALRPTSKGIYLYLTICLRKFDVSENTGYERVNILYLTPHRQRKQYTEIHDQDRPVNGDVKHIGCGEQERDNDSARRA